MASRGRGANRRPSEGNTEITSLLHDLIGAVNRLGRPPQRGGAPRGRGRGRGRATHPTANSNRQSGPPRATSYHRGSVRQPSRGGSRNSRPPRGQQGRQSSVRRGQGTGRQFTRGQPNARSTSTGTRRGTSGSRHRARPQPNDARTTRDGSGSVPQLINDPRTTRGDQFQSENPDFVNLIRATNQGARLHHAQQNWERLPTTIGRAVDKIANSVRPPLMDDGFQRHIQRAAASFKEAIRHTVSEHLVSKYTGVRRQLGHLDNRDMEQARAIARRQILRSNQRMTTERVDQLLTVIQQDVASGSSWELATGRRTARHPPHQGRPTIDTSNRFQGLSEVDSDTVSEATDSDMEADSEVISPTPKARKQRTPPSSSANQGKKAKVDTPAEGSFARPRPPGPGAGTPKPASNPPGASTTTPRIRHQSAAAATSFDAAPSPVSTLRSPATTPIPSPVGHSPSRRASISLFAPNQRGNWAIPEIFPKEDTLLLTDSNGRSWYNVAPATWRVAAYRGGGFRDVCKILESSPIPPHVQQIVIAVGINDREGNDRPIINDISRLRELIQRQTRRVAILPVPQVEDQPQKLTDSTTQINQLLRDFFAEMRCLVNIPDGFLAERIVHDDFRHYNTTAAKVLVDLALEHFSSLN